MKRSSGLYNTEREVLQYSTIIGSVPPKPDYRDWSVAITTMPVKSAVSASEIAGSMYAKW